ncbi:MAG: PAS domain S-box protein [Bacteroidetes bacterium]|jgi:PAS domain S-box-containing protein|nr:PAS domain S-box protein [Bacteroidota bacterium]
MTKVVNQHTEQCLPDHADLQKVYDYSAIGMLAIDTYGIVRYVNEVTLAYMEQGKNDILGQSLFSFYSDADSDKSNEGKLMRLEEITDCEFKLNTSEESVKFALISSKVLRIQGDTLTYLFIRDISALKKKERLYYYINASSEELALARDTKSALEKIAQLIVPTFADWFTIDIVKNDRFELQILKHKDPDKIEWAYQYRKNYPPDPNGNAGAAVVLKTGKPGFVPVVTDEMISAVITDPDQLKLVREIGMQSVIIVPVYQKDKIIGVANFISSRKERHFDDADLDFARNFAALIGLSLENTRLNEEALNEIASRKRAEYQFRFLADAIPHKIWTAGPDGRATYYNQQWYDYTGTHSFDELRGKIWDIMHPDDRAIAEAEWPRAIQNGIGMELEQRFMRHDGVYRWHLSRFAVHKDEEGKNRIWVGASTDIHEQKESRIAVEAINLDLSSANEELASLNEEWASTNEELAATNEELRIAQNDLQGLVKKVSEGAERRARLAAIVDSSDDAIVSKTLHGIITSWNRGAEKLFGYTEEEAVGKHISLIIPTNRLKEEEFIIGQISQGRKVDHFETIRVTKTGQDIPISLTISPIIDENGNVIGASKIARDISKQKEYEETLQRYTQKVETLNTIGKLVSESLDLQTILQKVTDAATSAIEASFGAFFYNQEDENGESYMLFTLSGVEQSAFESFGMPRNTAVFHPTFSGEGVVRSDDITKDPRYGKNHPHYGKPKGHLPVVSYLAVPVISQSGEVIGGLFFGHTEPAKFTKDHEDLVVSIATQAAISIDNARLYDEVKLLNEKKDEFIGLASHELKTPLTSITGYLQILGRLKIDEQSGRFVDKTIRQVRKLSGLVNDLLDVSKIEAGKLQMKRVKFDLIEIINDTIELMQQTNDKYTILLETGVETCMVRADSQRVEQVMINLLSNAIKYSHNAGKIIVKVNKAEKDVTVSIQDFGIGIAANKLGQVFSRFYRVDDLDAHISGLGIGLYLCYEIISRHNGKIWVESVLGAGSTFYFSLPLN